MMIVVMMMVVMVMVTLTMVVWVEAGFMNLVRF